MIKDTGGQPQVQVEADRVEVHGHLDGKMSAQNVVVGIQTGVVEGDD